MEIWVLFKFMVIGMLLAVSSCSKLAKELESESVSCKAQFSEIQDWQESHATCTVDSDCQTEYGGCFLVHYNRTGKSTEIQSMVRSYLQDCADKDKLCGINPGTPKCEAGKCSNHYPERGAYRRLHDIQS